MATAEQMLLLAMVHEGTWICANLETGLGTAHVGYGHEVFPIVNYSTTHQSPFMIDPAWDSDLVRCRDYDHALAVLCEMLPQEVAP